MLLLCMRLLPQPSQVHLLNPGSISSASSLQVFDAERFNDAAADISLEQVPSAASRPSSSSL